MLVIGCGLPRSPWSARHPQHPRHPRHPWRRKSVEVASKHQIDQLCNSESCSSTHDSPTVSHKHECSDAHIKQAHPAVLRGMLPFLARASLVGLVEQLSRLSTCGQSGEACANRMRARSRSSTQRAPLLPSAERPHPVLGHVSVDGLEAREKAQRKAQRTQRTGAVLRVDWSLCRPRSPWVTEYVRAQGSELPSRRTRSAHFGPAAACAVEAG